MRCTLGSWQAATGASLQIIGATLGHKSVAATKIYSRLNIDPIREAMRIAVQAMFSAGGLLPTAQVTNIEDAKNKKRAGA